MTSPVTPQMAKAVIIESGDSVAVAMRKLFLEWPPLFYRFLKWYVRTDGGFTDELNELLCSISCSDASTDTTI